MREKLTQLSGYELDWFNVGGLAIQRSQQSLWGLWTNYTWREYFIRGGIVVATIAGGALGVYSCSDEECYPATRGLVGASIGFTLSHMLAVTATVRRRNQISLEGEQLREIAREQLSCFKKNHQTPNAQSIALQMETFLDYLSTPFLPVKARGDAIQNLIKIRELSKKTQERLDTFTGLIENHSEEEQTQLLINEIGFWQQSNANIVNQLYGSQLIKDVDEEEVQDSSFHVKAM